MRSSKSKSFIVFFGLLLLLFGFLATQNVFIDIIEENSYAGDYNGNLKRSKPWDKIHIVGNQGWLDFKNAGNCTGLGIYSNPYVIEDLEIDGSGSGSCMLIENSDVYFRIENCSLCYAGTGEYDSGIRLSNVTNGFLFRNHCYNNSQQGILLTTCTNNTLTENLIEKNNYSQSGRGMIIRYSHFNSIFNNTISENFGSFFGYGMGLIYSDNNTFSGNKILKNKSPLGAGIGLEMYFCSNNTFTLNIIIDNPLAIRVSDSSNNNRFIKNNMNGNAGFEIFECNYTLIFQNEIYAESYAFYLKIHTPVSTYSCQFNKIIKNNITTSNSFGITITDSYNNSIYHNNFQNSPEIRDNGANNSWDDGFAGNYWSHYSGVDNNPQDGIIDTPYSIAGSAGASDNKPLKYLIYEDYDGDGLTNYEEYTLGIDGYRTNVTDTDTDSDGMPDYWESYNSLNPTIDDTGDDPDNDMLENIYEFLNNTDPQDNDTDNDNLLDGEETVIGNDGYITNATNPDTDYDILLDGEESALGVDGYLTNPTNPDSDFDKLSDYWEWLNSTDP